jgi:hypothetical protein
LTSEQRRAWPRMGIKQHLACWPWSAQVVMKALTLAGVMVAGKVLVMDRWEWKRENRTGSAVQVGEVEDVSCAADGVAGAAEADLALLDEGSSHGTDGESEDGGVEHVGGFVVVVG